MNNQYINIENTRFIFPTNLGADPARDRFARPGQPVSRRCNIVIPNPDQAREMIDMGIRVKQTEPRPGEEEDFVPTYYVAAQAKFRPGSRNNPRIHLVSDGFVSDPLPEEALGEVDRCYVLNVDVTLNPWQNPTSGNVSLYIQTMYVVQDVQEDPYAAKYSHRVDSDDGMATFA